MLSVSQGLSITLAMATCLKTYKKSFTALKNAIESLQKPFFNTIVCDICCNETSPLYE